jgi:hypothetical protein
MRTFGIRFVAPVSAGWIWGVRRCYPDVSLTFFLILGLPEKTRAIDDIQGQFEVPIRAPGMIP